ncbi:hypothetical protein L1987_24079 [Smallanthus sonchifolius]|uniref:Uncharacterized protein n=1 Tax=Smallanthus sonchifolius TaxID=185202 RepID=A0ACB9IKX9_9ASTR|nr:hypothetical protein L1987_24079 [Smallanthus sonchifolius]
MRGCWVPEMRRWFGRESDRDEVCLEHLGEFILSISDLQVEWYELVFSGEFSVSIVDLAEAREEDSRQRYLYALVTK